MTLLQLFTILVIFVFIFLSHVLQMQSIQILCALIFKLTRLYV